MGFWQPSAINGGGGGGEVAGGGWVSGGCGVEPEIFNILIRAFLGV